MEKQKIIDALNEIADWLEIKGENSFKCNAYRTAARTLEVFDGDFSKLIEEDKLAELKGIGKSLAEKITTLTKTDTLPLLEELRSIFPNSLLELLKIPGVGPKKVKTVFEKFDIKTVGELEYACNENRLVELPGFGLKTQEKILKGIELYKRSAGRFLVDVVSSSSERLLNSLKNLKEVNSLEVAGSLRRARETVKDIDILVASKKPEPIMKAFVLQPKIAQITNQGETKSSIVLEEGISADLRVVSPQEFPFALNYFTGSKEHNVALRSRAIKMGFKLNEYGLFKIEDDKETLLKCKNEKEIYKALGLAYIPPELREDRGEIEAAEKNKIPELVSDKDVLGIFHIHTDYSDGIFTLRNAVEIAKSLGLIYIGVSDHSQTAAYANGLKPDKVKQQWEEIDKLNEEIGDFKIFKGIESDILVNGALDYDENLLSGFDFVIGSVHSHFNMKEKEMTDRIIRALENPYITMLGHPTGRLLLARDGYPVDMDAIIETSAKNNVILEINANPYRLDLDWRYCRKAIEKGIILSINPDTHRREGFEHTKYGVGVARKGWCEKHHILNTRTADEVLNIFKKKKS